MSDSKKLPIIEVGDNSEFEIDFAGNVCAKFEVHNSILSITAAMNGHGNSISLEKIEIAEVIKPTKERMYSEEEMRYAVTNFAEYYCTPYINEHGQPALSYDIEEAFAEIIQSLNK